MKDKSKHHKKTNTFHFQGFYEKLKSLHVSSSQYILKRIEDDDQSETLLWQTLQKWKDLDLTSGFKEFQHSLGDDIQTMAQLLLNEDRVVRTFKTHLDTQSKADALELEPEEVRETQDLASILNCLVAFARDIPDLFYKNHFYQFLQQLITLTMEYARNHKVIENIFIAIVSLFTLLQRYLKDDFYTLYVENEFCRLFSKRLPSYINELAAQTVASLIRKQRDLLNKNLLICLKWLTKNDDQVKGVGRLLFHCLKSDVARRLRKTNESISPLVITLDFIVEGTAPIEETTEVVIFCIQQLAEHVTSQVCIPGNWDKTWKEDAEYIWPFLYSKLKAVCAAPQEDEESLISMLKIIHELAKYRKTALVTDYEEILVNITSACETSNDDEVGMLIGELISTLLATTHYSPDSSTLKRFLGIYFSRDWTPSVVFYFVHLVLGSSYFENIILPLYKSYIVALLAKRETASMESAPEILPTESTPEILSSLVGIICNRVTAIRSAVDLKSWSRYPITVSDTSIPDVNPLNNLLESCLSSGLATDLSNLEQIIKCCICLPHVAPLSVEDFIPYLFWIMKDAVELTRKKAVPLIPEDAAETKTPPKKKRKSDAGTESQSNLNLNINVSTDEVSMKMLFLISFIAETLHHSLSREDFLTALSGTEILSLLLQNQQYRENIHLLKAVDIHLTTLADSGDTEIINEQTLQKLYPVLAPSLASEKALVRFLVSHILSIFPVESVRDPSFTYAANTMFEIMYEVESNEFSPLQFKERLRILSYLDINYVNLNRPVSRMYDQAPLLFLIGQLWVNFREFWSQLIDSITSYAYSLPEDVFWPLWASKLKLSSYFTMRILCGKSMAENKAIFKDDILNDLHSDLSMHPGYAHLNSRPNYMHFRDLLWQAMQRFPNICEKRNKDVVTAFLDFMYNELLPADYTVAPTQDLSAIVNDTSTAVEEDEEMDETEDLDDTRTSDKDESFSEEPEVMGAEDRVRKAPTNSLCEQLALFAKFHNPKVIYKSKELEKIYVEFLSHPYLKAQKLALCALMAYNPKCLMPYKETLFNILNDKLFKHELTVFDIEGKNDNDPKSLKAEHRAEFMPILLRILYGKMLYKTGGNTAGKRHSAARKATVLGFLAGASDTDLQTFLDLSFAILLSHLDGNALEVVKRTEENLDITKVVPLRRMQGALGTLETMLKKIGSLIIDKRPFLLKVILFILSTVRNLLKRKPELRPGCFSTLRVTRQMAVKQVITFCTCFDDYNWTPVELEALFEAVVWPSLEKLPEEALTYPTPLMRLFSFWADNHAYQPLLMHPHPENSSLRPFPYVIKLLKDRRCSPTVVAMIYSIIDKLLAKEDKTDKNEQPSEQPMDNASEHISDLSHGDVTHGDLSRGDLTQGDLTRGDLTRGEQVVHSCLNDLLECMKSTFLSSGKEINKRDLGILIHVAPWVTRGEDGKELLDVIIPIVKRNFVKENEKVSYLLDTCANLLQTLDNPRRYASQFVQMVSVLNSRAARTSLCAALKSIYSKIKNAEHIVQWSSELNAWSEASVDDIDTERRLKCYKVVNRYLKTTDTFSEDIVLFLIHQNIWTLNQIVEQALCDLACVCMKNLFDMILRLKPEFLINMKRIVDNHLIPLLKTGLRNPKETVRNSVMSVLGFAVSSFHDSNRKLKDLHKLCDEEDPDSDFFTNMSHIQRGRRTRTLVRLAEHLNEGKIRLNVHTIMDFILPVTTVYLFKEEYSKDHDLLTGSIICVGALAKQLPWNYYQTLLKRYLHMVTTETKQLKLGVRLLESVLDAFHEEITDEDHPNSAQALDNERGKSGVKLRVYNTLTKELIPKVQYTLGKRSSRDSVHKVNLKEYPEDEDIKRIPLALALVKLLKKLPKRVLDQNVDRALTKLIVYLQSRAESIRREARNMLVKVMVELGGEYFPNLVSDLRNQLTKGYQSHVMVFTLHSILTSLQDSIQPEHIAQCVSHIVNICLDDLFGHKSEEKDVENITSKILEARFDKGYTILGLVSQSIPVDQLDKLITPLKDKLKTNDKKIVNKISCCLQKIGSGLERNSYISMEHKSVFIYGILMERIKDLAVLDPKANKKKLTEKEKALARPDSYLLDPEPRRVGMMPKTSLKSTSHALVEFALKQLFDLLKHNKFVTDNTHHCSLLDAYVKIMSDCLLSEYPQVSIEALHVIGHLIKFPLPSLEQNMTKICGQMFLILNKFASPGLTKGKIFELVQLDFKTISLVIKEATFFKLNDEQVSVLLHYARSNLDDYNQHQSSFLIIGAIISRKWSSPELNSLMMAIREMSIMSSDSNMLDQARLNFVRYSLNCMKKKNRIQFVNRQLLFYVSNVSYDIPEGRMSAMIAVAELISKYPGETFDEKIEISLWFKITAQLIKETFKEHRTTLQKLLKALFLKSSRKNLLVDNCMKLLEDDLMKSRADNALSVHMGAESLLAMLDVQCKDHPPSVSKKVIPKLIDLLHPARFQTTDDSGTEIDTQYLDLAINSLLDLLQVLMEMYLNHQSTQKWLDLVSDLWDSVKHHLLYPNLKVRLDCAKIFGRLFGLFPIEKKALPPIASTQEQVKSLVLDFCEQLNTECGVESPLLVQLGLAVVRNLVYLIRQSPKVPIKLNRADKLQLNEDKQDGIDDDGDSGVDDNDNDSVTFDDNADAEDKSVTFNDHDSNNRLVTDVKEVTKVTDTNDDILVTGGKVTNVTVTDNDSNANLVTGKSTEKADTSFLQSELKTESNEYYEGIYWVLHRVGILAYKELNKKGTNTGKNSTFRRESLLNLIAAVVVVLDKEFPLAKNVVNFVINHVTRELSDRYLPEPLKKLTEELAELVSEKIGAEWYSELAMQVQANLSRKRLVRKAHNRERVVSNPEVAMQKKAKKYLAKKESKKRKIKEFKLRPNKKRRLRDFAMPKS